MGFYRVDASLAGNIDVDQYFTVGLVFNHMAKICNISVEFRFLQAKISAPLIYMYPMIKIAVVL